MELFTTICLISCNSFAVANLCERRKFQEEIRQQAVVSVSTQVASPIEYFFSAEDSAPVQVVDDNMFDDGLEIPDTRHIVLHFKHRPKVIIDQNGYFFPTWNVRWSSSIGLSYKMLGGALLRQFVSLYNVARKGTLSKAESKIWANILRDVDYADYCEQIRPPLPAVGVLIRRDRNKVVVRMSGGKEEELDGVVADALRIVEEGERFSVMFKRSKGKIVVFEDVCPLKNLDLVVRDDLRSMLA